MTSYQIDFAIDFGEVGGRFEQHPFRVRLDIGPLSGLIRASEDAHRVYELLLIDRPGDVWDYVWVILDDVPKRVADRVRLAREDAQLARDRGHGPWPPDRIPFNVFDGLFCWAGDDTDPEDSAWLHHRDSDVMRGFAQQAMTIVRAAQNRLDWSDHLVRHIVSRVRSGSHAFCFLDREVARSKSRELGPGAPQHTPAFYAKLGQVLRHADLVSVAYRAEGDHRVLRMLANEQRRRANITGHHARHALFLSALVSKTTSNEAWDSWIAFYMEGLAHGDLFIEGGGLGGANIKALVESRHEIPGRYILSTRNEGQIAGFDSEAGDGWVLYTKRQPDSRRTALQQIEFRRADEIGAVLSFGEGGPTLFGFDKTVLVVGEQVSANARSSLAAVVAEWQRAGGDPVLVVQGDIEPFGHAGFTGALLVPVATDDDDAKARWLGAELQRLRPWMDAVVTLHAPGWVTGALADRLRRRDEPWPAWTVSTRGEPGFRVDHWVDDDVERVLIDARLRAQPMRPKLL